MTPARRSGGDASAIRSPTKPRMMSPAHYPVRSDATNVVGYTNAMNSTPSTSPQLATPNARRHYFIVTIVVVVTPAVVPSLAMKVILRAVLSGAVALLRYVSVFNILT